MHVEHWSKLLDVNHLNALIDCWHEALKTISNQHRSINTHKKRGKVFKTVLVEKGFFKLATEILYHKEKKKKTLSSATIRTRLKAMIELLISHDASVGVAQNFIVRFMHGVFEEKPHIKMHFKEQMTPLVIKDINLEIDAWQNDPARMTREALNYKDINSSQSKQLKTRKNVCLMILKFKN